MMKSFARITLVLAGLGIAPLTFADEVVHFSNGAEMAVRGHDVDQAKNMVRLDLGEKNFISFPMSMVDKIVNSGRDVFLNPVFHPSNQAIPGSPGSMVADTAVHGTGPSVGLVRQNIKGGAGAMLGESADALPAGTQGGPQIDQPIASSRRRYNPLMPQVPGAPPQVILPPQMTKSVTGITVLNPPKPDPAPPPPTAQVNQAAGTSANTDPGSADPDKN